PHGFDHVARAGFAFGTDHRGALADAPQRFAQVAGAAHERHFEGVLVDVVLLVGGCQHLGLVDVVYTHGFEELGLDKMPDAGFGHDGNGDGVDDLLDQLRIGHARDAAVTSNVGGDALEGHDSAGASVLGDFGLVSGDHVHDDPALEHLGEATFGGPGTGLGGM